MKSAKFAFLLFSVVLLFSFISLLLTAGCGRGMLSSSAGPVPTPAAPGISNPNNFTYVTVQNTSKIEGFKIDSTGAVVAIPGSPFAVPDSPMGLVRTQQFLFVASINFNFPATPELGLITTYRIDPNTGALIEVARQNAVVPSFLAVDSEARFLYVTVRDGVSVFSIGTGGQLQEIPGSPFNSSAGVDAVVGQVILHPGGKFLYSVGIPPTGHDPSVGTIVARVDSSTGAASQGQFLVLTPTSVNVTPDGKFLLATTSTPSLPNAICSYTIDPVNGFPGGSFSTLVPQSTACASTGTGGFSVAVVPSGPFAVVLNEDANTISVFKLSSGTLTQVPGSPFSAGIAPLSVAVSRDGHFLFVANGRSNDVTIFQFDSITGALSPVSGSTFKLTGRPFQILS